MNDTPLPWPGPGHVRPKQDAESILASISAQLGQPDHGQAPDEEPLEPAAADSAHGGRPGG